MLALLFLAASTAALVVLVRAAPRHAVPLGVLLVALLAMMSAASRGTKDVVLVLEAFAELFNTMY